MSEAAWLDAVKWTDDGLVPVVAQDATDSKVLMVAWMILGIDLGPGASMKFAL